MFRVIFISLFLMQGLMAEASNPAPAAVTPTPVVQEERVESHHTLKIGDKEIPYTAVAGTVQLKNKADKVHASIFYVSYTQDTQKGIQDAKQRPITFCFNGGPGSSSIWLHMGVFGPARVELNLNSLMTPPYQLVDNPFSLLDVTDLVFIDPVSTGFSKAAPGEDPKQFYGVDEDVAYLADFIMQWTTQNKRWESPKYIAGESYGATRAANLAQKLNDDDFYYINGILLVSSVLNYQTLFDPNDGNDLPYVLLLPSYTAAAWYHHKLDPELQKDLSATLNEAKTFALEEFGPALLQGDALEPAKREALIHKFARLTGLPESYVERSNLRVPVSRFTKELLRDKRRTVGRFDARYQGIDGDVVGSYQEYDPSLQAVAGAFAATFNQYLTEKLRWESRVPYKVAAFNEVNPWNWGKCTNCFLNVGEKLRDVMSKNPNLRVYVACGRFDLATPFLATEYTFNHLNLDPSLKPNVSLYYYDAGHMMYLHPPALIQMKKDLSDFYSTPKHE